MTVSSQSYAKLRTKISGFKDVLERSLVIIYPGEHGTSLNADQLSDPIKALSDMASLTHAHTTKIGLAFRRPISIEAAEKCLDDSLRIVPVIVSAYVAIKEEREGILVRLEARCRLDDLFKAQIKFLDELAASASDPLGPFDSNEQSRLVSIGQVWECCDSLKDISNASNEGLVVKSITRYSDLIDDALGDLTSWLEDPAPMSFFDEDESDNEGSSVESDDRAAIKSSPTYLLASKWADRLTKMKILYSATIKRRCNILDNAALNKLHTTIDSLSGSVDDLVVLCIDGSPHEEVEQSSETLLNQVIVLLSLIRKDNNGNEDRFSIWIDTFRSKLE